MHGRVEGREREAQDDGKLEVPDADVPRLGVRGRRQPATCECDRCLAPPRHGAPSEPRHIAVTFSRAVVRAGFVCRATTLWNQGRGYPVFRWFRWCFVAYAQTKRKRNSCRRIAGARGSLTPDNVHLSEVRLGGFSGRTCWGDLYFVSWKYVGFDETNATIPWCPTFVITPDALDRLRAEAGRGDPRNTVTIRSTPGGALGGNGNGSNRSRRHRRLLSL